MHLKAVFLFLALCVLVSVKSLSQEGSAVCFDQDGGEHPNGQSFQNAPCEWCFCEDGEAIDCSGPSCPTLVCPDGDEPVQGDNCCTVCPNGKAPLDMTFNYKKK